MLVTSETEPEDRKRIRFGSDLAAPLALILIVAFYLAFSSKLFNDGDTSWHLGAGRLILDTLSIPATDPFSFTFRGSPWTAHEWLAEVIMAAAFAAGSWGGVALLATCAVGGLLLILAAEMGRWLPPRRVIIALTLVLLILSPFILARPHVLVWPFLAGWTIVLLRAREAHRAPPLAFALLMIPWANMHGSFVLGLLLVGVFALEALIEERDRRGALIGWALFGIAALILSLLTPHGIQGLLFPIQVSAMKSLPLIMEWRRTDLAQDWLFLVVLGAILLLLLLRRPRISPVRLVLLGGLVYLALGHVRHQPLLAILGSLILAEPLSRTSGPRAPQERRTIIPLVGAFMLGMLVIAAFRLSLSPPRLDSDSNPVTAIRHIPAGLRSRPVLNSYGFGGPLILENIRPFIDGRGDMYGDAFMFEHQRIMNGDSAAFDRAVGRWDIGWTILAPDTPLVRRLDRSPQWQRIYADQWAVMHSRRQAAVLPTPR